MSAVRMGDPLNDDTEIGPLARHDLRDTVHRQVEGSIAMGARCLLGGTIPNSRGAYYPPTVLTDVAKGMLAFDEEVFGPVAGGASPPMQTVVLPTATSAYEATIPGGDRVGLGRSRWARPHGLAAGRLRRRLAVSPTAFGK
jgi:Aldehyde dehydrogenase family